MFFWTGCKNQTKEAIVVGGSMAPHILGDHFEVKCTDCQYPFVVGKSLLPQSGRLVCPNCGCSSNTTANAVTKVGRRFSIGHAEQDTINRWDLVAAKVSDEKTAQNHWLVKRVVGLPGESINIMDGNIIVDGEMAVKPIPVQQSMWIPVFDSKYNSGNTAARRFDCSRSGWICAQLAKQFLNYQPAGEPTDWEWIDYKQIRGYWNAKGRFESAPIEDAYSYNQNLARRLNRVNDLKVNIELANSSSAKSNLAIRFKKDEKNVVTVHLNFADRAGVLKTNGNSSPVEFQIGSREVSAAVVDGLVMLAFGDQIVVREQLPHNFQRCKSPTKISLGAKGPHAFSIAKLQIFRDIFYLPGTGPTPIKLGQGEYFILGDNPPLSRDSRDFGPVKFELVRHLNPIAKP